MSSLTKETAKEMYQAWIEAERAVITGKSYRIGTRQLQRCDLKEIREAQEYWRNVHDKLESGRTGARVLRAVPRDL